MMSALLELIGIKHGPADPLDQLARKVIGLKVGRGNSLSINDCAWCLFLAIRHYKYLRHGCPFLWWTVDHRRRSYARGQN